MTNPDNTPIHELATWAWLDGEIVPRSQSTISLWDHALHYSQGLIEGLRFFNGNIFLLEEHTKRLLYGVERQRYENFPFTDAQINQGCKDICAAMELTEGYIRPLVTRGSESLWVGGKGNNSHLAIGAWPLPGNTNTVTLVTSAWRRAPANCLPVDTKCAEVFSVGTKGKIEAEEKVEEVEGVTVDALFLDLDGYMADSSASNITVIFGKELHVLSPDCTLFGITQKVLIILAMKEGYKVVVRKIKPEELVNASEAFICGTALEVHPITKVDDMVIKEGPITKALIDQYNLLVRSPTDTVDRILGLKNGLGLMETPEMKSLGLNVK